MFFLWGQFWGPVNNNTMMAYKVPYWVVVLKISMVDDKTIIIISLCNYKDVQSREIKCINFSIYSIGIRFLLEWTCVYTSASDCTKPKLLTLTCVRVLSLLGATGFKKIYVVGSIPVEVDEEILNYRLPPRILSFEDGFKFFSLLWI